MADQSEAGRLQPGLQSDDILSLVDPSQAAPLIMRTHLPSLEQAKTA